MKMVMLVGFVLLYSLHLHAQTFNEWFRQKKTQREYLIKQVVLLQQYLGYARKGYNIVQKGLGTISQIKNGDLKIHLLFFRALKEPNPFIAKSPKAVDIITSVLAINASCDKALRKFNMHGFSLPDDRDYARRVLLRIRRENDKSLEDLLMVTTSNQLQLSDDQRLSRIDQLHADVKDRGAFVSSFINQLELLSRQYHSEIADVDMQRAVYGLK
ncbi:hypothetical protein [Chitinophaga vietnamensis]|uniref:hypothetical protein n=1 Tax=Chitinophaga vietnamensis TaxID=2593957 RepID=UPI0011777A00|nr:hypothetical protein [Chitinophaga vietnamensis]